MKKKIIVILFICFVFTALFSSQNLNRLNTNFLNIKDNKFAPDTATNLQSFTLTNYYPINTPILFFVNARCGNGGKDTLYSGTLGVKSFEINSDSSVFTYTINFSDTTDYFSTNDGGFYFYLENPDTEMISFKVYDTTNNIKSSFYSIINFVEKADTVTKMGGTDDTLFSINSAISFFWRFYDDSNRIFPNYSTLLNDTALRVIVLNNADSSIIISNFGTDASDTLYPVFINGGYYMSVQDTQAEDIYLVFEPLLSTYPLAPETLHLVSVPSAESPMFMTFSFNGYNQTMGLSNGLLMINWGDNGPVASNNTSQVKSEVFDMTGNGITIDNNSWQTLNNGAAQSSIYNNITNECIVLKTQDQGSPDLSNITPYIGLEYKDTLEAILGKMYIPRVAIVNDTIDGEIFITDGYFSQDTLYKGFGNIYNTPYTVLNYSTLQIDNYPEINNGYGQFKITYNTPDSSNIAFNDGEGDFIYNYFSTEDQNFYILWKYATTSPTDSLQLYLPENKIIKKGDKDLITIAAIANDSISSNFNGNVSLVLTGSAVSSTGDSVYLTNGIGSFYIQDTLEEMVEITVSSVGIQTAVDTINFVASNKAIVLVVSGEDQCIVNEQTQWSFFAMSSNFTVDTTFNGYLILQFSDTTGSSSVFANYPFDSIPIVDGIGDVTLYNTEPERINFSGYAVSGTDTIAMENRSLMTMLYVSTSNDSTIQVYIDDTLNFYTMNYDSSIVNYNTLIDSIEVIEGNPNSSFTISDSNNLPINAGIGNLIVSNTEDEHIDIYGMYFDSLLYDNGVYKQFFSFDAYTKVEEMKNQLKNPQISYLNNPMPNPFNNYSIIKFGIAKKSNVRINIYDQNGRLIKNMINKSLMPGHYLLKWDAKDNMQQYVGSGVYFIFMNIDNTNIIRKKLILIR